MTRRFGETFARTFGSALVHGVYASDSRKLSIRAAFPTLWAAEDRGLGSVVRGFLLPAPTKAAIKGDYDLGDIPEMMQDVSVYSFKDGMETITNALERYLSTQRNVIFLSNTSIDTVNVKTDHSFEVRISTLLHQASLLMTCFPDLPSIQTSTQPHSHRLDPAPPNTQHPPIPVCTTNSPLDRQPILLCNRHQPRLPCSALQHSPRRLRLPHPPPQIGLSQHHCHHFTRHSRHRLRLLLSLRPRHSHSQDYQSNLDDRGPLPCLLLLFIRPRPQFERTARATPGSYHAPPGKCAAKTPSRPCILESLQERELHTDTHARTSGADG